MDDIRVRKRGRSWAVLPVAIIGVLIGALLAGALTWSNPLSSLFSPGEGEFQQTGPVIIESIRDLSELTTVEMVESTTVEQGTDRGWLNFATGDRLFLFAVARISAGVDLSSLESDDIVVDDETGEVTITLPEPIITSVEVDNEQTRVYSRDTGLLVSGNADLERLARVEAQEEMVQAALEAGLLERAEESTESALEALLTGLGHDDVTIRFTPSPNN